MSLPNVQFGQRSTKLYHCSATRSHESSSAVEVYDLPPSCPTFRRHRRFDAAIPSAAVSLLAVDEVGSTAAVVHDGGDDYMARRVVFLFDMRKGSVITEMVFEGPIVAVRITTQRLAVILAARTHLYQLPSLMPLPQIASNPPNHRGLGALSTPAPNRASYFAWPHRTHGVSTSEDEDGVVKPDDEKEKDTSVSTAGSGTLVVLDTSSSLLSLISAFADDVITCIEFAPTAEAVATCATSGTLIKVFAVPSGEALYTLRRGTTSAVISSITFSPSSAVLLATSGNGTLHVFRCGPDAIGKTTKSSARLSIPNDVNLICGMSADDKQLLVVVEPTGQQQAVLEMYDVGAKDVTKTTEFVI